MIKRVLVDTDVILDIALARKPFYEASRTVLALLENNAALGFITSNSAGNIYYILKKAGGDKKARIFISRLLNILTILAIDHSTVIVALDSGFKDFEDALQNYSAEKNQCQSIITRNTEDYQKSGINIYSPLEFLHMFQ